MNFFDLACEKREVRTTFLVYYRTLRYEGTAAGAVA